MLTRREFLGAGLGAVVARRASALGTVEQDMNAHKKHLLEALHANSRS